MSTFSLWLTLPEPIKSKLDEVVADLANRYEGPLLEPHITLVTNISTDKTDAIEKTKKLASLLEQVPLTLADVTFSVTYFQCVLVRVTPTAALLNAHLAANKLFGLETALFMPHISLFYGHKSMAEREQIAQSVQLGSDFFICNTLTLVPAVPNPVDWHHIADFPLQLPVVSQ